MLCFDFQGVINVVYYGKIRPLYSTVIASQLLSGRHSEIYAHCNQTAGLDVGQRWSKGIDYDVLREKTFSYTGFSHPVTCDPDVG